MEMTDMEKDNGVIVITPEGEILTSYVDDINPRHWCCFVDVENKLNLESNCGIDQMEHAWYLARQGILSLQIAKSINWSLITSPEIDTLSSTQLEKLDEILKNDVGEEIDFVLNDKHRPVIINNNSSFKIDELNEIFHFNNLEKHKTR